MRTIYVQPYHSPVGELLLGEFEGQLCLCDWVQSPKHAKNLQKLATKLQADILHQPSEFLSSIKRDLDDYFQHPTTAGLNEYKASLLILGTEFDIMVRKALMTIGCGQTISYQGLANLIGRPKAVRAVANVVANNPISIFIPCHRVIGSKGQLTGYAGGLTAKQYLLSLDQRNAGPILATALNNI